MGTVVLCIALLFASVAQVVDAGGLSDASVSPTSLVPGTVGAVDITFTTSSTIAANGTIEVTFPSGFDISNAVVTEGTGPNGASGTFTVSKDSSVITITRNNDGGAWLAGVTSLTLDMIRNPGAGATNSFAIKTMDDGNNTLDFDDDVAGVAITS